MNILNVLSAAAEALKQGKMLTKPENWKNAQVITNALYAGVVLLNALDIKLVLTSTNISTIANAIIILVNIYLTLATSEKVGLLEIKKDRVVK